MYVWFLCVYVCVWVYEDYNEEDDVIIVGEGW